jgi:tetratricopeptide (TPR) repeat protein
MHRLRHTTRTIIALALTAAWGGLPAAPAALADGGTHAAPQSMPASPTGQLAPRLQNLGTHTFPVTTTSPEAQLFINQGVMLAYGFNHPEAHRAFQEAARLDPRCAMAHWGMALVGGPNINMPMAPEAGPTAYASLQQALALKDHASEKERAYIEALAARYAHPAPADRSSLDRAYAQAMEALHRRFPEDLDAATLYAEALMDLSPWAYWTRDKRPHPETQRILQVLEAILARHPSHPGALHLYIHAVEYGRPELAEDAADRLGPLAPGAGHLVHMPSHIFRRVGRYAEASQSNVAAIAADEDYIVQCRAQGVYPLAYYPHNIHFLWDSATMEGRQATAVEAARKSAAAIPGEVWREVPLVQQFLVAPLQAYTRFGLWAAILEEPRPPEDGPFLMGMWHYARGLAYTATGHPEQASGELEGLRRIAADPSIDGLRVTFSRNGAKAILDIGVEVLAGELAARQGDVETALAHLHRGALLEDNLIYNEPPDWHVPVRHSLGAVLLAAGRAAEAEAVYWQDLERNRENGWALFGLAQSLRAQGQIDAAAGVEARFQKAWRGADVSLSASRFMGPSPAPTATAPENARRLWTRRE